MAGRRNLFATLALIAPIVALSGDTKTTREPDKVEIVTADVAHFWQAFEEAATVPMAGRVGI
jgi:hypothetical protein